MSVETCIELTPGAIEGGTYVITAVFTDEDGNDVTPATLTWTLTDESGDVINSREDIAISPASTVYVVLSGDDLDAGDTELRILIFTLNGTYNSAYGSDLPLVRQARVPVVGTIP